MGQYTILFIAVSQKMAGFGMHLDHIKESIMVGLKYRILQKNRFRTTGI